MLAIRADIERFRLAIVGSDKSALTRLAIRCFEAAPCARLYFLQTFVTLQGVASTVRDKRKKNADSVCRFYCMPDEL